MLIQTQTLTFPPKALVGNNTNAPGGIASEVLVSELTGRYSHLSKVGKLFTAYATLTAPVIFSTAAGTGGPLLWNKLNSGVEAHILAVGFSTSVVTTVAGGLGFTGNSGQSSAPTSTTAIDGSGSLYIGGASSQINAYRVGTVVNAGAFLLPFAQVHTGALTVDNTGLTWIDVGGAIVIPQGCWGSVAGSATLSTLQVQIALIWAELPA